MFNTNEHFHQMMDGDWPPWAKIPRRRKKVWGNLSFFFYFDCTNLKRAPSYHGAVLTLNEVCIHPFYALLVLDIGTYLVSKIVNQHKATNASAEPTDSEWLAATNGSERQQDNINLKSKRNKRQLAIRKKCTKKEIKTDMNYTMKTNPESLMLTQKKKS